IPTLPQYLQSLRRVLILNCEVAHPGHGGPIANPNARARELITHHEQRKEEIAGMIRRGPKTLAAICGELFPKLEDASLMLALSDTDLVRRRPGRLRMFAWVVAGALAALLGRHLLNSADHSI